MPSQNPSKFGLGVINFLLFASFLNMVVQYHLLEGPMKHLKTILLINSLMEDLHFTLSSELTSFTMRHAHFSPTNLEQKQADLPSFSTDHNIQQMQVETGELCCMLSTTAHHAGKDQTRPLHVLKELQGPQSIL